MCDSLFIVETILIGTREKESMRQLNVSTFFSMSRRDDQSHCVLRLWTAWYRPVDYSYAIGAKYAYDLGLDNADRQRCIMDGVQKKRPRFLVVSYSG
jgi:hypothetical protein